MKFINLKPQITAQKTVSGFFGCALTAVSLYDIISLEKVLFVLKFRKSFLNVIKSLKIMRKIPFFDFPELIL